jgi:hypothetical protein
MELTSAILVRVGIDASYGRWNAPADPITREFVYVPIPEACQLRAGHVVSYSRVLPVLQSFSQKRDVGLDTDLGFRAALRELPMHLDPDFDFLTYGDDGSRRGREIALLQAGDFLVFYAGMRSVVDRRLVYGLVGLLTVDEIVAAADVPEHRLGENAHTRRLNPRPSEVVVRGVPSQSGRLTRYLPIGEWRDGAYRVRRDLLDEWGGLSVRNGFIQRSVRPPHFLDPEKFRRWLGRQDVVLTASNN